MKQNKILLLTGPGGAGKSTIAEILEDKYDYLHIDGDQLDTEYFPNGGHYLPENKEKLQKAHQKIFLETKKATSLGRNIVINYIIFGDYLNFINLFKKEFGDKLIIRVLLPSEAETILRDKERECWTTGEDRIRQVRAEFFDIIEEVGRENFIDTSGQTPEETLMHFLSKAK